MELDGPQAVLVRPKDMGLLLGRLLFSMLVLEEGVELIGEFDLVAETAARFSIAVPAVVAAIAVHLVAGAAIALGLFTRVAAFLLALSFALIGLAFHTDLSDPGHLLHLEMDLGMALAMMVLGVVGAGKLSLDMVVHRLWKTKMMF